MALCKVMRLVNHRQSGLFWNSVGTRLVHSAMPLQGCGLKSVRQPATEHAGVRITCLVDYIRAQFNGPFNGIEQKLFESAAILDYDTRGTGSATVIEIVDAKVQVEDIGACSSDAEEFLYSGARSNTSQSWDDVENTDCEHDISAYNGYHNSFDIIQLAISRGAHVYKEHRWNGGPTHIKTASGPKVILQTLDKAWDHKERSRKMKQLKSAGIRAVATDSDPRSYCAWRKKFGIETEILQCGSNQFSCLRVAPR